MTTGTLTPDQEKRVRQALAKVPFARLLGIEAESFSEGEAVVSMPLGENLKQNSGIVHGGTIASLIDTATALAIVTRIIVGQLHHRQSALQHCKMLFACRSARL